MPRLLAQAQAQEADILAHLRRIPPELEVDALMDQMHRIQRYIQQTKAKLE